MVPGIFLTPGHMCPLLGVSCREPARMSSSRRSRTAGESYMTTIREKRVLITGAGQGLGRELVRQFAAAGAEVIATDRDEAALAETVTSIGGRVFGYPVDVTAAAAVLAVRDRVHADRGPIDIIVN